uniref:von Willebrand factor-like n=1 Tax=Saccoglossus kowalevskii TaxID=10224 RepID=A0ABM0LU70_SACKO|nr:PREDICTED: von Willebrand factor-like [Saccoglossus kowalevskii]
MKTYWNGDSTAAVVLSKTHQNSVCGLCGNFNGNQNDEFIAPAGDLAPSASSFGESWRIGTSCHQSARSVHDEIPRDTALAEQICNDLFNSGNISDCTLDPAMFSSACLLDLSATLPNDTTGGCAVVATYVAQCQAQGTMVGDWRTGTECEILCPADFAYTTCGSACPPTCEDPYPVGSCTEECIEGCFCEPGKLIDSGQCIDQADCGCYYLGVLYRFGETQPNEVICSCNIPDTVCVGCRHFEINTDEVTWATAKSNCESQGGRLAMIDTQVVFNNIRKYIFGNQIDDEIRKGFWFGLDDIDVEGSFVWSDGTPLGDFTKWAKRQPNNNVRSDPNGQDCAQLWKLKTLKWDDTYCSQKNGYICEYTDQCI